MEVNCFFLHVQQVVLPYMGCQPWPLRWWIYNRLRGKGTAVGRFGRFVFGAFLFDAKKIGRLLCGGYLSSTFACARLSFCFVQVILWSGWDASSTQKTKRSFVEGSENPSPRLTVFECNSWSWKLVKLRIVIIIICTLPRARSPLHFRVILVSIGTNDHTDLPCFCQRSGELSMGMKKRKSNYSLQNQFESLRTDGVVRCIRQKRVFDDERREIKLDHTCRYRISCLKYLRPNLFGSDIPRRKNTCILCSITVIFINLLV